MYNIIHLDGKSLESDREQIKSSIDNGVVYVYHPPPHAGVKYTVSDVYLCADYALK